MPTSLLLCDDVPEIREFLRDEVARHSDLRVVGEASDGLEALELTRSLHPDLVMLDISMPNMDGIEALSLIVEESPDVAVIVLTGVESELLESELLSRGAAAFILKGASLGDIIQTIRMVAGDAPAGLESASKLDGEEAARADGLARSEMLASESFKMAILEAALDCVVAADVDGRIIEFNLAAERAFGYTRDEVLGRRISEVLMPDRHAKAHDSALERYREHGSHGDIDRRIEVEAKRKDGTEFPVELALKEVDLGGVTAFVAVIRDITRRKAMEESLRASEERFRSLVQNSRDVIAVVDESGLCSYVSPGVERLAGYTPNEILGRSSFEFIHPEDRPRLVHELAEIVSIPDATKTVEARVRTRSGSWLWIEFRAANRLHQPGIKGIVLNYHDITERKDAEQHVAQLLISESESAENFRLLLDSTGEGIFGVDTDGMCTFINRSAARMLGGRPDDFVGKHMHSLSHHSFSDGSAYPVEDCSIYAAYRSGEGCAVEGEVFWRLDGTSFPVAYSSHPIGGPNRPVGAVLSFRDETERLRMEQELRSSEALFRNAFSAARTGIALIDGEGNAYVHVNDALCAMLGYEREELLTLTWRDITHPDDLAENVEIVEAAVAGGPPVNDINKRYIRKDGKMIFVQITDSLVHDAAGAPLYFVTHVVDVTEKKAATDALQENEQLLRAVVDNSPALIYIKDLEGRYLLANERVTEDVTRSSNGVLGLTVHDIFIAEVAEVLAGNDAEVLRSGQPLEVQEMVPDHEGALRTYWTVKFPLFDVNGDCYALCGISTDITERARAVAEKDKLEGQLKQSQKMEAVGQLAGGIAHDFNNLLAVILNYADFLKEDLEPGDPRGEDVSEISKAADKAARLVHQLLAFSRKEVIEPTALNINDVVGGLEQFLLRSLGEHIELVFHPRASLPLVEADQGQFEQVIVNLAVNARDAMPDGGHLTVDTGIQTLSDGERGGLSAGDYVVLRVRDTGQGMSADVAERIFEPFFTTKDRYAGTGLGLSTAYGIVKQAGGGIYVHSGVGQGTTFHVYLPVAEDDELRREEPQQQSLLRPSRDPGGTIVLVEDEEAVRDLITRILEKHGFDVMPFASGDEAMAAHPSWIQKADLLLTDVVMPKMSGKALSDAARKLRGDLITLYMSGYTDEMIARNGELEGGEHLIQKPFKGPELVVSILGLLEHQGQRDE